MKNTTTAIMAALIVAALASGADAVSSKRYSGFNDHGLVACRFIGGAEYQIGSAPVTVNTFDCTTDGIHYERFVTVDKTFNTSVIDEDTAEKAAAAADPSADFFATIGRIHFFKSSHSTGAWK
ncbi:MAG TPA: hypothetical protein ENJ37_10695 [Deltaproteobacteria bacterium]|nr:hypothetical protein [Deltaproteobacteria bacterium]